MSAPRGGFPERFCASLRACGVAPGDPVLVAVSGGCDSVVLLHLLRFAAEGFGDALTAAHFDHAMRPESRSDCEWVAGLCAAWNVPLSEERTSGPLRGETDARRERYAFLRRASLAAGARWIATAHHADDQAETVLFRALRGTGPDGLAGIARRSGQMIRPLLPFWRREVRLYAHEQGIRWRSDPSNRSLRPARNRLRREIIPRIERTIAPAGRRSLVRLSEVAREERVAWTTAVKLLASGAVFEDGTHLLLRREAFRAWGPPLAARVVRSVFGQRRIVLGHAGTRRVVQFITESVTGRCLELPGGARLYAEHEVARLVEPAEFGPDRPLRLDRELVGPGGFAAARVGGRAFHVSWSQGLAPDEAWAVDRVALRLAGLRFPLELRARRSGDWIRTAGGSKLLKKLLIEHRVPRPLRSSLPLLADPEEVIWVRGLIVAANHRADPGSPALLIRISDA